MDTLSRNRLLDKLIEAYVDWREACAWVGNSYRDWSSSTGLRGNVAFAFYMAALDAEEEAAQAYAGLVQRVSKMLWSKSPGAEPLGGTAWRIGRT